MKTCGQLLVDLLGAYGLDTVFGIPGTHALELYRGLSESKLRHISARHEQGAVRLACERLDRRFQIARGAKCRPDRRD